MKTPEQYFEEQDFNLSAEQVDRDISPGERLFIEKYLGEEGQDIKQVDQPEAASRGQKNKPAAKSSPEPAEASPEPAEALPEPAEALPVQAKASAKQGKTTAGPQPSAWAEREKLRSRQDIQLVSFFIGSQEFALPIETVKEVIKYIQPTRLPTAPPYLEVVINLRQRVTPIVCLA
ncbi:MAG: chemotaxis protein CheW, partial [Desulfonatronovibrionaceae bacterium]